MSWEEKEGERERERESERERERARAGGREQRTERVGEGAYVQRLFLQLETWLRFQRQTFEAAAFELPARQMTDISAHLDKLVS